HNVVRGGSHLSAVSAHLAGARLDQRKKGADLCHLQRQKSDSGQTTGDLLRGVYDGSLGDSRSGTERGCERCIKAGASWLSRQTPDIRWRQTAHGRLDEGFARFRVAAEPPRTEVA